MPANTIYQLGVAVNIIEAFYAVDPVTEAQTPVDPSVVVFTILAPDETEQIFTWPTDPNVTHPETGVFVCALDPPTLPGSYRYRAVGSGAIDGVAEGNFTILSSGVVQTPQTGPLIGPCSSWISGSDVANCCGVEYEPNATVLDQSAFEAGMALFEISGRQFAGGCERTVRPCRTECSCWPGSSGGPWWWGTWPFGTNSYSWSGWGWWNEGGSRIGCQPMSRVKLGGYPVREIVQVLIDGEEVPEFDGDGDRNWRLDGWRWLTRMNKPGSPVVVRRWPSCQDMSLDATEQGTFEVTYRWGQDPPPLGRDAACEIACQLFLACAGSAPGDCVLPAGVTRLVRQNVEIERGLLANWLDPTKPTGLVHVDLFLRTYWLKRARRRSALWSPDVQQFARRLGT